MAVLAARLLLILALAPAAGARAGTPAELVAFPGPDGPLAGILYRPAGAGPFPAVLWNHGSERWPGGQPDLADYFVSKGFVFFMPHRAGHGQSPGHDDTPVGPAVADGTETARAVVASHERINLEVMAAGRWLMERPFVDARAAAMVGCSFGGIQTLLAAEKGMGFRAFVAFAPGAKSWRNRYLRDRLARAVASAQAPVFILQAENDVSTGPTRELGPVAAARGGRFWIYPAYGTSSQDGHWAFATEAGGTRVWGEDVMGFLRGSLAPR
jgi:dienelactone hydrolase